MSSPRSAALWELKQAITEYEEKLSDCEAMDRMWREGDPFDQADNDPGLQYEAGEKLDKLWQEVCHAADAVAKLGQE